MKNIVLFVCLLLLSSTITAQNSKKRPLTHDDILKWERITKTLISNDGKIVVYQLEPWKGDPTLKITTPEEKEKLSAKCATNPQITSDGNFVVFNLQLSEDSVRQLKLKKAKKEDFPKDKLAVYNVRNNKTDTINDFVSVKVPEKWAGWIAWQTEAPKDTTQKGEGKEKGERRKG